MLRLKDASCWSQMVRHMSCVTFAMGAINLAATKRMHTLHLVMMQLSRQKMRNNDNTAHASLLPRCIKQELTKQFAALRLSGSQSFTDEKRAQDGT